MHCCNVVAQEGYPVCWVALQGQEGARAVNPLHKGSKGRLDLQEGRLDRQEGSKDRLDLQKV